MAPSPELDGLPFDSLYRHGFVRVAAAVPYVGIAEPDFNAERTLALAERAAEAEASLVIFPELGISGYAIDDLLHQRALLAAVSGGSSGSSPAARGCCP